MDSVDQAIPVAAVGPEPVAAARALDVTVEAWSPLTYPDEANLARRLDRIRRAHAKVAYGRRSLAPSTCPDTGRPVRCWAVEGEEVISPYTGRRYLQGPTGYFGPKGRGGDGRITAFGGDPLKRDLPAVLARLLRDPTDERARAFVGIPGNLNQQYHFAAVTWARLYPLLAAHLGPRWRAAFRAAVAGYREDRRPSDGPREHAAPLSVPHTLVGEPGELLGGNRRDGGTENHKIMWRTTALLYAQTLGPDALISGVPAPAAAEAASGALTGFLRQVLTVGHGEYDSSTYYPHSVAGFLNLHDLSPDEDTTRWGKFAADYYLVTYGLKMLDGVLIGPQRRGFSPGPAPRGMDALAQVFLPVTGGATPDPVGVPIQVATTRYRPNSVIANIIRKRVPLPFEARLRRPSYHLEEENAAQEYFYCDDGLAMGSVQLTRVDNPAQQTVWSLGCRTTGGTAVFGGGHPRFRSPQGHSPYTQVFQHRQCLVLLTRATAAAPPAGELSMEQQHRLTAGADALEVLPPGTSAAARWCAAPTAAESWLFVPRLARSTAASNGSLAVAAGDVRVIVRPIGDHWEWMEPTVGEDQDPGLLDTLRDYRVLVCAGGTSGFVIDAVRATRSDSLPKALAEARRRTSLDLTALEQGVLEYQSLAGHRLRMSYSSTGLRPAAAVDGRPVDWATWAGGAVCDSPYVRIGSGCLRAWDGRSGYQVDCGGARPRYRAWTPGADQ